MVITADSIEHRVMFFITPLSLMFIRVKIQGNSVKDKNISREIKK